jgi:hypothetical protein
LSGAHSEAELVQSRPIVVSLFTDVIYKCL